MVPGWLRVWGWMAMLTVIVVLAAWYLGRTSGSESAVRSARRRSRRLRGQPLRGQPLREETAARARAPRPVPEGPWPSRLGPRWEPPVPVAPVPVVDPTVAHLERLAQQLLTAAPGAFPWELLLQLGDVYFRGAYPRWRPDVDAALACYQWAARAPRGDVAGLAQAKYIEARTEPVNDQDVAGQPLDPTWAEDACDAAETALFRTPADAFGRPLLTRPPAQRAAAAADETPHVPTWLATWDPPTEEATRGPAPGEGDAQNVHDHAVVAFLRERVHRDLPAQPEAEHDPTLQWTTAPLRTLTGRLVQHWQAAGVNSATVHTARKVLEALSADDHYAVSISEVEALRRVLQKMESLPAAHRTTLLGTLADQLASGVEAGYVVCSTGRLARIVGMLDIVDTVAPPVAGPGAAKAPLVMRPLWAVQEELATLAAKVRDEALSHAGPDARRAYEVGGPVAAGLSADMQAAFEAQVHQEYVERLGMNPSILRPLVDTWKAEL